MQRYHCFESFTASYRFRYHKLRHSKAWQKNRQTKNITLFRLYSRRATQDLHHTWRQCSFPKRKRTGTLIMASAGARAYMGVWGSAPSGVQGQCPGQGSGGEAPLNLKAFLHRMRKIWHSLCRLGVLTWNSARQVQNKTETTECCRHKRQTHNRQPRLFPPFRLSFQCQHWLRQAFITNRMTQVVQKSPVAFIK